MKPVLKKLVAISLIAINLKSQNLVTNSTFEGKYIKQRYGEITKANAWRNANTGTADLFDKRESHCKNSPNGIPNNYMGYQQSGDGQNYAGIVAYYDDGSNDYRPAVENNYYFVFAKPDGYKRYTEYIEGEFRDPMVTGSVYQVSFRISLANNSGRAVSCIGALLSNEKVNQSNNTFLKTAPQFISHRVISDTTDWVILSGAYIAAGGEKYITIGCFRDENFLVEKVVDDLQNDSRKAYYYISEVSVTPYVDPKKNMDAIVSGVDYMELMNVEFASGTSEIMQKFYNELDDVANWMVKYPEYKFFIAGYTDQQGESAVNNALSLERAGNVKKYLVSKGVNENNIITEGFGSGNPVENKMKSRKNRRVEIYLYSVGKVSQL